ncbi:GntR family transcriptional regulator [Sinomonas humi]|uniref:GntR family transcriptional regulator n=1 Tax=Sinomonas humi TaxID=1338436 RepID=A0A0B2AM86_9MICC|nr:GntR family transcriptional regulator [Sinomonas humi]KHL02934.1 GntR family transcriptional regulator [Sinomonas humi]
MSETTAAPSGDLSSLRSLQAYQDLRSLLISGRFPPNHRLTEAELGTLLDVSRGTVRSVIVRLVQEGYLTSEPNRGVRTRMFSIDEAVEILEAREILESALAGKAAERATDEELEEMAAICEQMATEEYDLQGTEYSKLNTRFHHQVRESARQPILSGFVDSLVYPLVMRQYRDLTRKHPRKDALKEHMAILYALQTRNAAAARAAMRHHVGSARRALLLSADSAGEVEESAV